VCPTQSIAIGALQYVIDADSCDGFAACVAVCPVNAISRAPSRLETYRKKLRDSEERARKESAPKTAAEKRAAASMRPASHGDEHLIAGSVEAILKEYEK
jgi:MinD superfamily P-loop ATPase